MRKADASEPMFARADVLAPMKFTTTAGDCLGQRRTSERKDGGHVEDELERRGLVSEIPPKAAPRNGHAPARRPGRVGQTAAENDSILRSFEGVSRATFVAGIQKGSQVKARRIADRRASYAICSVLLLTLSISCVSKDSASVEAQKAVLASYSDDALDSVEKSLKKNPADGQLHFERGEILAHKGRDMEALDDFLKAESLGYASRDLFVARGRILERYSPSMAIDDYTKALRLNPKDPLPLFYRGELRLDQGEIEVAVEDLEKARDLPSELDFIQFDGTTRLGDAHYLALRFPEATTFYLDAARQHELAGGPSYQAACLYKAGLCSLFVGETATADVHFAAARELDPSLEKYPQSFPAIRVKASKEITTDGLAAQLSPTDRSTFSEFFAKRSEFFDDLKSSHELRYQILLDCQLSVALEPRATVLQELALRYDLLLRTEDAREAYDHAKKLAPTSVQLRLRRGRFLYRNTKDYPSVIEDMTYCIEHAAEFGDNLMTSPLAEAYYIRGNASADLGNAVAGKADLLKAHEIEPGNYNQAGEYTGQALLQQVEELQKEYDSKPRP